MFPTLAPARMAGAAACALAFAVLWIAVASGAAQPVDLAINAALAPLRMHDVLAAFAWITALGAEPTRFAVIAAVSFAVWSLGRAALLRPFWTVVLGSEATTWVAKLGIDRARPVFLPGVATASSPSFPSAHAAGTLALIGALAMLAASGAVPAARRRGVPVGAALFAALIGFSRLLLNVHFPSDVASGFCIAGFWLCVTPAMSGRVDAAAFPPPGEPAR